jgi:SHS family lactate transporter-like MFS transporter
MCLVGGALLYPYTFVSRPGIFAAAFFEQFCIEGAFGIIPIHLIELSPVPFRAFVVGTSYHLGVLVASASNTIEASIAERYLLRFEVTNGKSTPIYDYSIPMCILIACTFAYIIFMTILGPEKRGEDLAREEENDDDRSMSF